MSTDAKAQTTSVTCSRLSELMGRMYPMRTFREALVEAVAAQLLTKDSKGLHRLTAKGLLAVSKLNLGP